MWWVCIPVILGILLLLYLMLGFYMIKQSLYVKKRSYETVLSQDEKFNIPHEVSVLPYDRVVIKGSRGYDLVASFMKARNVENSHKYFLIFHGYNSNRVTANKYANILLDMGYNTLCPDMRACGESGGKGITFGIIESLDINLWIEYVKKIDPLAEISLYGISLGAASSIMVASQRDDIKMLISYCSYMSFKDILVDRVVHEKVPKFVAYLMYPFMRTYIALCYGNIKAKTNIVECIKKVKCPVLIMHSNGDEFTNIRHAYALKEARPDAMFKEFDGAPHARSYGVYPEEYRKTVEDFVRSNE